MEKTNNILKLFISNCARCQKHHEIEFKPLTHPNKEWTHWSICENSNEPVMLSITKDKKECHELLKDKIPGEFVKMEETEHNITVTHKTKEGLWIEVKIIDDENIRISTSTINTGSMSSSTLYEAEEKMIEIYESHKKYWLDGNNGVKCGDEPKE